MVTEISSLGYKCLQRPVYSKVEKERSRGVEVGTLLSHSGGGDSGGGVVLLYRRFKRREHPHIFTESNILLLSDPTPVLIPSYRSNVLSK